MWTQPVILSILMGILGSSGPPARAQRLACNGCEAGVRSEIVFETTRTNVLTVDPAGRGETLESAGITLRMRFLCNFGSPEREDYRPVAGIPGESIVLYSPEFSFCIPLMAAQPTDANGWTEFHGTFRAGGCVERVQAYADGLFFGEVPLRFNSPDSGTASPGRVDSSDLVALAAHIGHPERYSFCFDFNEDGQTDSSDLAYFSASIGGGCP